MNTRLAKKLALIILLPIIGIAVSIAWWQKHQFATFTGYFDDVAFAIQEIADLDREATNTHYLKNVEAWNDKAAARMNRVYKSHANNESPEIVESIALTRKLFDKLFTMRRDLATIVTPLLSEQMADRSTLDDKDAYEWRKQTLAQIDQSLQSFQHEINLIETFRQTVVNSNLPEKHRTYVWQTWGKHMKNTLTKLEPEVSGFESLTLSASKYFDFMYTHRDGYYVKEEDGEIVITNKRYVKDYLAVANAVTSIIQPNMSTKRAIISP